MPLSLSYTWEDSEEVVVINVKLPPTNLAEIDLFATDSFVKINFPKYLLQIDLFDLIDDLKSTSVVEHGKITFTLIKQTPSTWPDLKYQGSAADCRARRAASLAAFEDRQKTLKESKKAKTKQLTDLAFNKQWDIEKEEKREIEDRKAAEQEQTQTDVMDWAASTEIKEPTPAPIKHAQPTSTAKATAAAAAPQAHQRAPTATTSTSVPPPQKKNVDTRVWGELEDASEEEHRQAIGAEAAKKHANALPPPRSTARIGVTFTQSASHLPLRTPAEEEAPPTGKSTLAKNADAVDIGEENAVWLKDRGDYFFRSMDPLAAANAYTAALQIDPSFAGCLSNRAACFLRLEDYARCVDDATAALATAPHDQLPPVLHRTTLVRRAAAYLRLGLAEKALEDYVKAANIPALEDGSDAGDVAAVAADMLTVRDAVQESEVVRLKRTADQAFEAHDFEAAVAAYTQAIKADPGSFQLYSNRAACLLALHRYPECVEDCTNALYLLEPPKSTRIASPSSSPNASKLFLKVLVRRGSAYCWSGQPDKGYEDYRLALSLDPKNTQLQNDLNLVQAAVMKQWATSGSPLPEPVC